MDSSLLEYLLNQSESDSLDFKREQYRFDGVDDNIKSEVLKDILSFVNAWRRTDAYILIGVEEAKVGQSKVVGVSTHLADHNLQQFVNSKTQRPVTFSYSTHMYKEKEIGIIHIPLQTRPIFLSRDYGRLVKGEVLIRRGSSTATAMPDEVALMGAIPIANLNQSLLDIQFGDVDRRVTLGRSALIESEVPVLCQNNIPDFDPDRTRSFSLIPSYPNRGYYRSLVRYCQDKAMMKPLGFVIKNLGDSTAYNVRIVITAKHTTWLKIRTESDQPSRPKKYQVPFDMSSPRLNVVRQDRQAMLESYNGYWSLTFEMGNIQPKSQCWSKESVYLGAISNHDLMMEAQVFADNLPNPVTVPLSISFLTHDVETDLASLEEQIKLEEQQLIAELDADY